MQTDASLSHFKEIYQKFTCHTSRATEFISRLHNLQVMDINVHSENPQIVAHRIYLFCITRRLGRNLSDFLYVAGNTEVIKRIIASKSIIDTQYLILKFSEATILMRVVDILKKRGLKSAQSVNINSAKILLIYKEPTEKDADYIKDLEKRIRKTREYLVK